MKVVCDGCQAKYKLTDGRLAGKKLKFRCRKCGNTILIDGAEIMPAPAPAADAEMTHDPFSQDAVSPFEPTPPEWYLSINGEPYGPCTTEQMASMLRDGQVPWETHVWREGYPEWKLAGESNTLVRAVGALFAASSQADEQAQAARIESPAYEDAGWSPAEYDAAASNGPGTTPGTSNGGHAYATGSVDDGSHGSLNHDDAGDDSHIPDDGYERDPSYGSNAGYAYGSYADPSGQAGDGYEQDEADHGQPARYGGAQYVGASIGHDDLTRVQYVDPNTGQVGYPPEEASGLIDIRALSALAGSRRNASLAQANERMGDGSNDRFVLTRSRGRFGEGGTIDTLAPVDRVRRYTGKAIPLAILAGSALIAVAALAIYSSPSQQPRDARAGASAITSIPDETPIAQQAEPSAAPPPANTPSPAPIATPPAIEPNSRATTGASSPALAEHRSVSSARLEPHNGPKPGRVAHRTGIPDDTTENLEPQAAEAVPAEPEPEASKPATPGSRNASATAAPERRSGPSTPEPAQLAPNNPAQPAVENDALPATAPVAHDAVAAAPVAAAPQEEAARKHPSSSSRSIDELLDNALTEDDKNLEKTLGAVEGPKPSARDEAAKSGHDTAGMPATPTREQVLGAMRAIEPDVKACTQGQKLDSYTAAAAFTVTGDTGRVGSVRVTGIQGPVGSCIARAVRNAIFPPFAKSQLRINFPFRLGP